MTDPSRLGGDRASIADDLATRIARSEFAAGDRLPGEHALAEEYGVSRRQVRTALASLARRGLLASRPRSGWVVQARHQTQAFDEMRSFAQWALESGRVPGGEIVSSAREGADARQARLLGIRLGEEVLSSVRVRTLDGRVVMVERSTWAPWVLPMIDAMPRDVASMTAALAGVGVNVVMGDHRIAVAAASSEDAQLLGVRRSSGLLEVRRRTATWDGKPVEFGEDRYVPDIIAFVVRAGEHAEALSRVSI
jgi:GntR family transcriptional regulator